MIIFHSNYYTHLQGDINGILYLQFWETSRDKEKKALNYIMFPRPARIFLINVRGSSGLSAGPEHGKQRGLRNSNFRT